MSPAPRTQHTLSVEQAALLCCMRTWVCGLHHPIPASASIGALMRGLGADEATAYLDTFMIRLGEGATRPCCLGRPEQCRVENDERLLLGILTYAQESRLSEALLLLRGLVSATAARPVLRSAEALGTELALAGRFLSPQDIALPNAGPNAGPAPLTLH